MKKLPEIQVKTTEIKVGKHNIEFRKITLHEFNTILAIQEAQEKNDQAEVIDQAINLIANLMYVDASFSEKKQFLLNIDIGNFEDLLELIDKVTKFSDLDVVKKKVSGKTTKKK